MLSRKNRGRREAARDTLKSVRSTVDTVVRRLVGSTDPEYEDLVQSSLVNVLATFDGGKFRGDCPPRGWAAVIARNVAVDAIRARARERRVFAHDGDALADERNHVEAHLGPEKLTDLHETLDRVNRALGGLGPRKARVVYLHDVLGYQLEEVATMLGTSVAAAQSRLVRGRREIIEQLDGRGRVGPPTHSPPKPSRDELRATKPPFAHASIGPEADPGARPARTEANSEPRPRRRKPRPLVLT